MKGKKISGFGERLARLRASRGLTQAELGERIGVSPRVIAYYEHEEAQPPGAMIPDLARALCISADELLGLKVVKEGRSKKAARLLKRLQKIEVLPPSDQRAVLKFLDALLEKHSSRREPSISGR